MIPAKRRPWSPVPVPLMSVPSPPAAQLQRALILPPGRSNEGSRPPLPASCSPVMRASKRRRLPAAASRSTHQLSGSTPRGQHHPLPQAVGGVATAAEAVVAEHGAQDQGPRGEALHPPPLQARLPGQHRGGDGPQGPQGVLDGGQVEGLPPPRLPATRAACGPSPGSHRASGSPAGRARGACSTRPRKRSAGPAWAGRRTPRRGRCPRGAGSPPGPAGVRWPGSLRSRPRRRRSPAAGPPDPARRPGPGTPAPPLARRSGRAPGAPRPRSGPPARSRPFVAWRTAAVATRCSSEAPARSAWRTCRLTTRVSSAAAPPSIRPPRATARPSPSSVAGLITRRKG